MFSKALLIGISALYLFGLVIASPISMSNAQASPISAPISLYIRGKVRLASAPLAGIKVQLFAKNKKLVLVGETTTASDGSYGFASLPNGKYQVSPVATRTYKFSPIRIILDLISNSVENVDFQAIVK